MPKVLRSDAQTIYFVSTRHWPEIQQEQETLQSVEKCAKERNVCWLNVLSRSELARAIVLVGGNATKADILAGYLHEVMFSGGH